MSSCRPHQRWVSDKSLFRLLIELLHRKECDVRSIPLLLFFHGRCHAIHHEEHDRPRPFTLSEVSEPFSHRETRHGERPKWAGHQMLAVPELNASGQWLGDVNLTLLLWFAQNRFDRILSHARSPLTTRSGKTRVLGVETVLNGCLLSAASAWEPAQPPTVRGLPASRH